MKALIFNIVNRSSLKRHVQKKHRQIFDSFEDITSSHPKLKTKKSKDLNPVVSPNIKNELIISSSDNCQESKVPEVGSLQVKIKLKAMPNGVQLKTTEDTEKQLNPAEKVHLRTTNLLLFNETSVSPKAVEPVEVSKEASLVLDITEPDAYIEDSTSITLIKIKKERQKSKSVKKLPKLENRITIKDPKKTLVSKIRSKNDAKKLSNNRSKSNNEDSVHDELIQDNAEFTDVSSGFECHLCQKKFSQRGNLLTHVKRIHSEAKNLRFVKIIVLWIFFLIFNLNPNRVVLTSKSI